MPAPFSRTPFPQLFNKEIAQFQMTKAQKTVAINYVLHLDSGGIILKAVCVNKKSSKTIKEIVMGKQLAAREKRARRKRYVKRKKAEVRQVIAAKKK